MKNVIVAVIIVFVAMAAGAVTHPDGVELEKFPVMTAPLTTDQMVQMDLRPVRLSEGRDFLQYNQKSKTFEYSRINPGEIVLVGSDGIVRYRASCGNRLAMIVPTRMEGVHQTSFNGSATSGGVQLASVSNTVNNTMSTTVASPAMQGYIPTTPAPIFIPQTNRFYPFGLWTWMWWLLLLSVVVMMVAGVIVTAILANRRLHPHQPRQRWGWCYRCRQHHWFAMP
jgi:hypothetical protein